MNPQYTDSEADRAIAVWIVALAAFAAYTTAPSYSAYIHPIADRIAFLGLLGLSLVGLVSSERRRDLAIGLPTGVFGSLIVWYVVRTVAVERPPLNAFTAAEALGTCLLGCLFVREAALVAAGRRRSGVRDAPPTRWTWWLLAALLIGYGLAGYAGWPQAFA